MTDLSWAGSPSYPLGRLYGHFSEAPLESWRWTNFSPEEIACKGTGAILVDGRALDLLQALRDELGRPMLITSGYRSPSHNKEVGGAERSQHLLGRAFDVVMTNHDPEAFVAAAERVGFNGIGLYPDRNFIHVDSRLKKARWGSAFPKRQTRFAPEPKPKKTKEAAEIAIATTAGVAVGQEVLTQAAPYLIEPWGRYALIGAVVLGGAAALARFFISRSREKEDPTFDEQQLDEIYEHLAYVRAKQGQTP